MPCARQAACTCTRVIRAVSIPHHALADRHRPTKGRCVLSRRPVWLKPPRVSACRVSRGPHTAGPLRTGAAPAPRRATTFAAGHPHRLPGSDCVPPRRLLFPFALSKYPRGERPVRAPGGRQPPAVAGSGGCPKPFGRSHASPPPHQCPVLPMLAQGSAGASRSPICSSSIDTLSGLRTKAMCPSRGGRLITTPAACSLAQVS